LLHTKKLTLVTGPAVTGWPGRHVRRHEDEPLQRPTHRLGDARHDGTRAEVEALMPVAAVAEFAAAPWGDSRHAR
jgi:hypothetical protein